MINQGLSEKDLQDAVVSEALEVVEPEAVAVPSAPPEVVEEAPVAPVTNLDDSALYIHRELSQLQFNIRVLEQALDESYPLLERLKFLLIFSSTVSYTHLTLPTTPYV